MSQERLTLESRCRFDSYRMPNARWDRIRTLLPGYKAAPFGGNLRKELRSVADASFYGPRSGFHWKIIHGRIASGNMAHAYFQEWVKRGIFADSWQIAPEIKDDLMGLDWRWQSIDGAVTKAPLGGESTWKNNIPPTS